MKAIVILTKLNNAQYWEDYYPSRLNCNEAIEELEAIKSNIKSSIEEIEWALAKPEYAEVYLNNALRFLKERNSNENN